MKKDLDNIKVGDEVAFVSHVGFQNRINITRGKVEKVTKTQVTALNGRRFLKRSGDEVGATSSRFHINDRLQLLTPELLAEARQDKEKSQAEGRCAAAAKILQSARGKDAVMLAALLPDSLLDE